MQTIVESLDRRSLYLLDPKDVAIKPMKPAKFAKTPFVPAAEADKIVYRFEITLYGFPFHIGAVE